MVATATTDARLFHHWQPEAYERAELRATSPGGLSNREPTPFVALGLVEGYCLRCGALAYPCMSCGDLRCGCRRVAGEGMSQHYERDGRPRVLRQVVRDDVPLVQAPVEAVPQVVAYVGRQVIRVTGSSREEL